MNNVFFKFAWFFLLSLIVYLLFISFLLIPQVNSYFNNIELNHEKDKYERIVETINKKIKLSKSRKELIKELKDYLSNISIGKNGYIYIVNKEGDVLVDPKKMFSSLDVKKLVLLGSNNKLLLNAIETTIKNNNDTLVYKWDKINDPDNYIYEIVSWIKYNKKISSYIVSSLYKDEIKDYSESINFYIFIYSIILFLIPMFIAIFLISQITKPLNQIINKIKDIKLDNNEFSIGVQEDNDINFLTNQFNSLVEQVEENKQSIEHHINSRTREMHNRLYYDDLTNLRNRTALEDDINEDEFVSIVLIDIDSFDNINELYGFATGNIVLIEVGNVLSEFSKKYNVNIYRVYGNVFALSDRNMMGFSKFNEFIENLSKLFKNKVIHVNELDIDIFVTITLGISIAQEEPLKAAAIALKKAKHSSQAFFVYNNEIDTKEIIKHSMTWQKKIKYAIENDNIVPFYQPIFDRDKNIVKYEVLMRMKDKNQKGEDVYLTPYYFFEVAIKTKQYLQINNQTIMKALARLPETTKLVSINLSFKDIMDTDFIHSLDINLDKIDYKDKDKLVFEILESDYIDDYKVLEEFIKKYRSQGIKIAIDDFGTGYSNFVHIIKIKPDFLKIDGSLIKDINIDKNSYEIVKSIVEFAQALNIKLVAEYVHSKDVFDIVYDLGIHEFQGFYLAEPQIIENFE